MNAKWRFHFCSSLLIFLLYLCFMNAKWRFHFVLLFWYFYYIFVLWTLNEDLIFVLLFWYFYYIFVLWTLNEDFIFVHFFWYLYYIFVLWMLHEDFHYFKIFYNTKSTPSYFKGVLHYSYRFTTNLVPFGLLSKTAILPSCNSTIFFVIDSPNPEELSSVVVLDLSTL